MHIVVRCSGQVIGFGNEQNAGCAHAVFEPTTEWLKDLHKCSELADQARAQDDSMRSVGFWDHSLEVYGEELMENLERLLDTDDYEVVEDAAWFILPECLKLESLAERPIEAVTLEVCARQNRKGKAYFNWDFHPKNSGAHVETAQVCLEDLTREVTRVRADGKPVKLVIQEDIKTRLAMFGLEALKVLESHEEWDHTIADKVAEIACDMKLRELDEEGMFRVTQEARDADLGSADS